MNKVSFLEIAKVELEDTIKYYDLQLPGLGKRFKKEAANAKRRIQEFPEAWAIERESVRKCLVSKFPYKLLYSLEKEDIIILAVAHAHRHPDYWVDRIEVLEKNHFSN